MAQTTPIYPAYTSLNGVKFELFSDDEVRRIDMATRDVLSTFGVQVSDVEARQLFKEAGCQVDEETWVVKIPSHVLDKALATCPKQYYLYGRNEENTFLFEWLGKVHYTCFGTGIQVCDYLSHGEFETRDSTGKDVANIAKLCDALPGISFFSLPVSAREWAGKGCEDVHEALISMVNSSKHFHHIDPVADHVKYYWEMVKAYYHGDEAEARAKPIMSMLVCPTSPLELSFNACQCIIQGARYGMPVNVLSMAMAGGSSSVYLAGTLVTHNAEILSGIVLSQLACPGAPIMYGSSTTCFDLKRGTAPVGSPELGLISAAVGKLGQYYKLPVFTAGM